MKRIFSFATPLLVLASLALAQTTTTSTTLSNAINRTQNTIVVASATGVSALGSNNQIQTMLVVDKEAMAVQSVSGTTVTVLRGVESTRQHAHNASAVVWVGPPGATSSPFFKDSDRSTTTGACTSTNEAYLPRVYLPSGDVVDCIASGPGGNSVWATRIAGMPNSFPDGEFLVPPGACFNTQSAHAGTLVGLGLVNGTPTIQGATTASASSDTITIACTIAPPFRTASGRGVLLTDAVFVYGNQTTNLGTQSATLASGTLNSVLVFSKFVAPAPGATETASSATLVRADSGTLAITPSAANFNITAVTAGQFYTQKFTPATPIPLSDLTPIVFTVTLTVTNSAATQLNSPGVVIHYINTPL